MCASALLALAGVALAVSENVLHASFYYEVSTSIRRVDDGCRVCYLDDCLLLSPARCEYFMEIDEITDPQEPDGGGSTVDTMISELTEQATMSWMAQECIPLISYHTNCNKENMCVGCESCHCTVAGKWSCQEEQHCRMEKRLELDHRTLAVVTEKLLEHEKKVRKKRLVENVTEKSEGKQIGLLDLAEWMYDVTPTTEFVDSTATSYAAVEVRGTKTTSPSTTLTTPAESEYLGFEEVLKNIANDQIYKRRKSQLYENSEIALDYMELEDIRPIWNNTTENFIEMLNAIEEGDTVTESTSDNKFVVDLYPLKSQDDFDDDTVPTYGGIPIVPEFESFYNKDGNNTIDIAQEKLELDPVNVMKRDVSFVTETNNITQDTTVVTTTVETTTERKNDLKKHVLIPLTHIINDKQNEVKELLQIRENLINIMEIIHNKTDVNITNDSEEIKNDTHFSIYKLDLYPELHEDLRRINPNTMDKLLYKLKRDIHEVFRDVAIIQKFSKTEGLPEDLKLLIRAMKYYVSKQGRFRDFKNKDIKLQKLNDTRRFFVHKNSTPTKSFAAQLADVIEIIDKDTPLTNDFATSSKASKKIIRRVIKQNFVDDYAVLGFKTFDTEYNLTSDLRTIGKTWPYLTAKIANSPAHEKLYAMKLLHLTLAGDINKITDALALIEFAHSRRMTPLETPMAEDIMNKINYGLLSIKHKIQAMMKNQIEHEKQQIRKRSDVKHNKKESFMKKIKNMLRNSKNEIIKMVKKKVPKTEIFRTIAQNKLDELSHKRLLEDEITMTKWQKAMSITRKKRDLASQMQALKNRMKNIIPKYLRGKINPALSKHKSKKQSGASKKNKNKHRSSISSTVKPLKMSSKKRATVKNKAKATTDKVSKSIPATVDSTTLSA